MSATEVPPNFIAIFAINPFRLPLAVLRPT